MYYKLFEKYITSAKPFHNRMLRTNYNVGMNDLVDIIKICISHFGSYDFICFCPDGFENGEFGEIRYKKISNDSESIIKAMEESADKDDAAGFFDIDMNFYIRASIEPTDNFSPCETPNGIFECYSSDKDVDALFDDLNAKYDLFFIREGSKKRLSDISMD